MDLFSGRLARFIVNLVLIICLGINCLNSLASTSNAQTSEVKNSTLFENSSKRNFDRKDISKVREYVKKEKRLQPVTTITRESISTESMLTPLATGTFQVQPILFVPQDMQEASNNTQAINDSFQIIRRWYSGALEQNNNGYNLNVADTIVYKASQPFSYYKCINHETTCDNFDGVWENVQLELLNAGYPLWTPGYSHVIMVKGAGGWAGSSCSPNCYTNWPSPGPASTSGVSILGDWALDGISGTVNPDCFAAIGTACYQDPQRGALGHELGHTFGLAHANDQEGSLMYAWYLFPYVSLMETSGNQEKSMIRNGSSFFTATPCTYDSSLVEMVQPASVKTSTQFTSTFNVMNYGFCKWTANKTGLYLLRDKVWGISSKVLTKDVYPAQSNTFSLLLKSPLIGRLKLPAIKMSDWQMRKNTVFFGPIFGSAITITR